MAGRARIHGGKTRSLERERVVRVVSTGWSGGREVESAELGIDEWLS
jgi:hypothetical protein